MFLGILAGLQSEARCLSGFLPRTDRFGSGLLLSAARPDLARRQARRLVEQGATHLLSFGLCGGLDPALAAGALVLPETILAPGGASLAVAPAWRARAADLLAEFRPSGGGIAGWDAVLAAPADKAACRARTGAVAVDMESHILAELAAERSLPFLAVRVVIDSAHEILPPAATVAVTAAGGTSLLAVLGSVLRRPGQIPALTRLGRANAEAMKVLLGCGRRGGGSGIGLV